jgi:hypothetical protein
LFHRIVAVSHSLVALDCICRGMPGISATVAQRMSNFDHIPLDHGNFSTDYLKQW